MQMNQRAIVLVLLVIASNHEVTYHWFPQLKEGTNIMSETFRNRMPVHEFKNFLTKYFDTTTNGISVLLDTLLLVDAHASALLLLKKGIQRARCSIQ